MNQKALTEADIRTKFITPNILSAGWDVMTQIREEVFFTKGRVIVRGKTVQRGAARKADHLLPEYEKLLAQIAKTRGQLKAQLLEALTR